MAVNPLGGELIQPLGLAPVGPVLPAPDIEQQTLDAGGAKPIDLLARDKLGGFPDPFAEFQDAPAPSFDQFQDAPDAFAEFKTADDLDVRSVDEIAKNRQGFDPVAYFAQNPDAPKDPAKLKKLLDVYRRYREEGLTIGGVAEAAVKGTPELVGDIAKGVKTLTEGSINTIVQPTANVVLGTFSGDLFDKQRRDALFNETRKIVRKGTAEVSAGAEAATVGLVDLSRTGLRKLREPTAEMVSGVFTGKKVSRIEQTDQELLAELSADASFRQNAEDILVGQGESAKNLGLDKETLAKEGIELDPEAIRLLSLVDPVTMIATGGAFKLVSASGKVLGTAKTLAGVKYATDKLAEIAKISAGKGIQVSGKLITGTGTVLKGTGTGAATIAGISSAVSGGGIPQSLIVGAAVKAIGPGLREGGKKLTHFGKAITGEVPVSAAAQKVIDYAIKPVVGATDTLTRGAFTGIVAGSPFAIAAETDEQAGALLGAGAALGAGAGASAGAFRVVKNSASRRYFGENRPVLEDVPSPGYGRLPDLDALNEKQMQKLSAQDASEVNNFREILRPHGGEFYNVDQPVFRQKVADEYRARTGKELTAEQLDLFQKHHALFDETTADGKKIVYLNGDATGLKHDAGHIFDSLLSKETVDKLNAAIDEAFPKEKIEAFRKLYSDWVGFEISPEAAKAEFRAEQFAALFNNVPVTELNAPKSLLSKFIDIAAEGAEVLGIDIGAGKTTPNLGAPVSVGIRKLFLNAAGEVTRRNVDALPEGPAPTNVTPLPPTPPPSPAGPGPVAPPTNIVPLTPSPANVAPLTPPAGRSIRVTPEQVAAFKQRATPEIRAAAAARAAETGVDYARGEAKKAEGSPTSAIIERISDSMESGAPVVGIEHLGITSISTPEAPLGRGGRRPEQAAGYAALEAAQLDVRQNAPPEIVAQHSKNFVPVRWTDQGGTPTLIAMSLDKVISNVLKIAADPKAKDLIPYAVENGKLTPDGWREVVADAKAYSENQANGRKGDGGRLEVPEAGLSIPAENPAYTPQPLTPERANFQNLVQGLAPPQTSRAQKGVMPGNVKGQILAEANRRVLELPANIPAKQAGKQAFVEFPPRVVQEVNPLRNEMARRGVNVRDLLEVTERIRAKDIVSATPKPEINYEAPVTDVIRGGFLPAPTEFRQKNLGGRTVEEFSDYVLKSSPTEWKAATDNMTGGLTGGAWNLGLGLKNAGDVAVLKSYADKFSDSAKAAMKAGEFDSAMSQVTRGQFFREAYEAATGTGSAGAAFKRGAAGMESAKPPFPIEATTESTTAGGRGTTEAAKFLPAEQLEVGTAADPELRIVPTPASAGGTPPIEPPSGTVIPPPGSAGRFQPAEQLTPQEETPDLSVVPTTAAAGGTPPVEPPSRGVILPLAAAKEDEDSAKFQPKERVKNPEADELAKNYAETHGMPVPVETKNRPLNNRLMQDLGDYFEDSPHTPEDPKTKASYAAFEKEIVAQGKAILDAGIKVEPWEGVGEPYANSRAMVEDVTNNKHLYFLKTKSGFGGAPAGGEVSGLAEKNLMTKPTEIKIGDHTLDLNEVTRFVHDFFGHTAEGNEFGPRGEFNAFLKHSQLFTPEAQKALTAELLMQAGWFFQGRHIRRPDRTIPVRGEKDYIPNQQRNFVEPKNLLPSDELSERVSSEVQKVTETGAFQPRTEAGRKLEERGYEIVASGEMGTRRVTILDRDKETIAQIQSVQRSPQKAEISFVSKKKGAPSGLGDILYREVGSRLRDDGVRSLGGQVISPEPLAIRKKIFGGFEKLTVNEESATYKEALDMAERLGNSDELMMIEPVNKITAATRFLPEDQQDMGFIRQGDAAIKVRDIERERNRILSELGSVQDKDRDALVERLAQVSRDAEGAWSDFTQSRAGAFQPREPKRDAQDRPLTKSGEVDMKKWMAETAAARKKQEAELIKEYVPRGPIVEESEIPSTGWILPDKKFVPLQAAFHEQYLADNAETLNKKFGTDFLGTASTDDRLNALNSGFVRLRNYNGKLSIEANAKKWSSLKSKVLETLQDKEGQIDSLTISLLNDKGQQVDSTSAQRLHDLSGLEKLAAIEEAVGSVRSGAFQPREGLPGIGVLSKEEQGRAKAARRIATVREENPEAVTPQYARDEGGEVIITPDGSPKPLTLNYNFIDSPLAKEAAKGLKGVKREEAAAVALGDELVKVYRQVEKNPDIKAGAKWYSTARTRLKKVFGDDAKFFAELLGATSARTPVEINYRFALDAYSQFKSGAYDKTIAKYREGKAAWEAQELGDFKGGEDATRGQFLDYWVNKHDLGVTQSNGKKFGMNSRAVLRVLDGSWASEVQGPKTPNFSGNLTGETFEATIDVWAGRTLQRLANQGGKARWRILPENETGISDADFYLGQAAYRDAAKKLGIKPDALQAVLWFAEKEYWEKKGWTRGAGAAKSDFNVLLAETERAPGGELRMKTPQMGLDFPAEVSDIRRKK